MNGAINRNINRSKQVSSTTSSIPVTASLRVEGVKTEEQNMNWAMNRNMNRKMNRNKKAVSTPSTITATASTKLSVVDAATKQEEPIRQDSEVKLDKLIRNGIMHSNIFRRNDDGEGGLSAVMGEKGPVDNALDVSAVVSVSAVASEPSRDSRTASTSQIFQEFLDLIVETSGEGFTTITSAGTQESIGDEIVALFEELEDEETDTAVSVNTNEARCTYNAFRDEGLFVCRTLFQPVTGEASIQTVCCDPERALETDQCGCCDGNCPDNSSKDRPGLDFSDFVETLEVIDFIEKFNEEAGLQQAEIVDLSNSCTIVANEPLCAYNSNGDLGKWVCRTIFSPTTGIPTETSSCSDPQRALVTDQCGCCNGECPVSPCRCPCDLRADGDNAGIRILVRKGTASKERCLSPSNAIKLTTRYEKFLCIDDCRDT